MIETLNTLINADAHGFKKSTKKQKKSAGIRVNQRVLPSYHTIATPKNKKKSATIYSEIRKFVAELKPITEISKI